ncbi:hypothetical protein L2E82_05833 [Cichorium intybus]|uniref:Uncharacterized protein n=1 Tax=Cichorium intybus TaxID=13427 RepID=A0ACB9H9Q0_CICIN|nr:hypothetical protein L2E82_05833 [Cichorium intybus]
MIIVGRDFSYTTQRDAVSPVSADVLFASSRFPNYKNRTNNNTLEVEALSGQLTQREGFRRCRFGKSWKNNG